MDIENKEILRLIRSHYEKDESVFRDTSRKIAMDLESKGKTELALFILSHLGETETFSTSQPEHKSMGELRKEPKYGAYGVTPSKHTVREVLDSLYWSNRNPDDEIDGYLHIVSGINGLNVNIPLRDIVKPRLNSRNLLERLNKYIDDRIKQHSDNLELWVNGTLVPTAEDEQDVEVTKEGLRACIYELKKLDEFIESELKHE